MTPSRRLLAVAILVVGLVGAAIAVGSRFGTRETAREPTFAGAGPISAVEVESESGRIDVVATQEAVKVRHTDRHLLGAPTVRQSVADGVLRLQATCPRLAAVACDVRFRLELPPTVALRVRAERGSVSVEGMGAAVDVGTRAGSISLVRTSGPVTARTEAGAIDGVDLAPAFLDASTTTGPIRISLTKPSPRLDLRTSAGNIDLALPPDRYRVETTTEAGKVAVSVADNAESGYAVRARTASGSIRVRPR